MREYEYITKYFKLDYNFKSHRFNTRKELDNFVMLCGFNNLVKDERKYETKEEAEKYWKE